MPSRMLSALVVSALVSTAMAGDPCGDPAAGSCNEANNTPGCDDLACCSAVCQLDSFCCDALWDDACVSLAIQTCDGGGGGGPANDFCAGATPIGEGVVSYSTVDATSDGPELPGEYRDALWKAREVGRRQEDDLLVRLLQAGVGARRDGDRAHRVFRLGMRGF